MKDLAMLPPFPGFRNEAFVFLRQLRRHNERDWFKPRKATYEDELKWPLQCLLADAARRLAEEDLPLTADPNASRFRIYRDTRFSNDKRPYKTHVSALLTRSGQKNDHGVVYIHIEPGEAFLAAGFYRPGARFLRPVRQAMVDRPDDFRTMLQRMEQAGLSVSPDGDMLKGMPQGFAAYRDHELVDYLKWNSLLVQRALDEEVLQTPALTDEVVHMTRASLPLLEYVWAAHGDET